MQVSVARQLEHRPAGGELGALALLGFGVGLAAGFLLSEVFGAGGTHRLERFFGRKRVRATPAAARLGLLRRVREALAAEPALASEPIEVHPRARGLELRGWVTSRGIRTLAYRLARRVSGEHEVINHLHVRDDNGHPVPPSPSPASSVLPKPA